MQTTNAGGTGKEATKTLQSKHKLIGLNKPWKALGFTGYYATVQTGKDGSGWFHSGFDPEKIPFEEQEGLFDSFKNTEENLWHDRNHMVTVECDGHYEGGNPIKPLIIKVEIDFKLTPP